MTTRIKPGNRQAATGNRQPATGNRQPATGNRQPAKMVLQSSTLLEAMRYTKFLHTSRLPLSISLSIATMLCGVGVICDAGGMTASSNNSALAAKETRSDAKGFQGFQGIEFFGSSLITRRELEEALQLKPGASYEQTTKALVRFKEKLDLKKVHASVDIASEGGKYYVVVDILDLGTMTVPTRRLGFAHHIILSSELPFQIFTELLARREQLAQEGRAVTESYDENNGRKSYSDEPCNQFAAKLHKQVPAMQNELIEVVSNDPDQDRRSKAIEVLNWTTAPVLLCTTFIPVVDDASEQVRASAARFIYPRIKMLAPNYPIIALVEVLSHQLGRPSNMDRVLALKCLAEVARTHPEAIDAIKEFDEDKAKELEQISVIDSVRKPAYELLEYCAHPPERPQPRKAMPNEF